MTSPTPASKMSMDERNAKLMLHMKILEQTTLALEAAEKVEAAANRAMMIANTRRRELKNEHDTQRRIVRRIAGLPPEPTEKVPFGWGELGCPKCGHRFIPSRLAGEPPTF